MMQSMKKRAHNLRAKITEIPTGETVIVAAASVTNTAATIGRTMAMATIGRTTVAKAMIMMVANGATVIMLAR